MTRLDLLLTHLVLLSTGVRHDDTRCCAASLGVRSGSTTFGAGDHPQWSVASHAFPRRSVGTAVAGRSVVHTGEGHGLRVSVQAEALDHATVVSGAPAAGEDRVRHSAAGASAS